MRCIGCYEYRPLFHHWFDTEIKRIDHLCMSCYTKHPMFIQYSVIPNEYHLIHIMHAVYDGYFPSHAYHHMDRYVIQWLINKGLSSIIIITDDIEEDMLLIFIQLDWQLIILNYENIKKRRDVYVI